MFEDQLGETPAGRDVLRQYWIAEPQSLWARLLDWLMRR